MKESDCPFDYAKLLLSIDQSDYAFLKAEAERLGVPIGDAFCMLFALYSISHFSYEESV